MWTLRRVASVGNCLRCRYSSTAAQTWTGGRLLLVVERRPQRERQLWALRWPLRSAVGGRCVSYVSIWPQSPRKQYLLVFGLCFGAAVSAYLSLDYYLRQNKKKVVLNNDRPAIAVVSLASQLPPIVSTRQVSGPTNLDLKLTLYQYQTCPFCCKVRAFMDYYGLPYDVVEVNPVLRQQIKFSKYKKVPILMIQKNGSEEVLQLNDSSVIISVLASHLMARNPKLKHYSENLEDILPWYENAQVMREEDGKVVNQVANKYFLMFGDIEPPEYKRIKKAIAEERWWRRWADDVLVHTISPNIYRTWSEALNSFRYFSDVGDWEKNFSNLERYFVIYLGAGAMYLIGKRLKKRHRLRDDVRLSLYETCNRWTKAVGNERKFMGGDNPNLADLAVFGVLNSIEGCEAFQDLLSHTSIGSWYYWVKESCKTNSGYSQLNYLKNMNYSNFAQIVEEIKT